MEDGPDGIKTQGRMTVIVIVNVIVEKNQLSIVNYQLSID